METRGREHPGVQGQRGPFTDGTDVGDGPRGEECPMAIGE